MSLTKSPCCETLGPIAPRPNKNKSKKAENAVINISVVVEKVRFIAFSCFWVMCAFAITVNHFFVKPKLAAGPPDGSTCPPFERNNPELGLSPGKGFDIDTQSHLIEALSSNNICVNWDYSPSRELTSILYPAFEYSLMVYVILDFVAIVLANMRGEIHPWFYFFAKISFPMNIFFCSQFRQIFVNIAYVDVAAHTAGFLGLQLCFYSVSIQNVLFILDTDIAYNFSCDHCGGPSKRRRNTKFLSICFLIFCTIVTLPSLYLTAAIVFNGALPTFFLTEVLPGTTIYTVLDKLGLVLNGILPLYLSYTRSKADYPLEIVISQRVQYENDNDEETKPLRHS